jgi:flagellin
MAPSINPNVTNLGMTHRSLQMDALSQSTKQLSSGLRISSAADDAAGLAVGFSLRTEVRGFHQAVRNANDAVNLIQTADGGTSSQVEALIRMRSLAVQSASDGVSDAERSHIMTEYTELLQELDRISEVTEFNGHTLLNGKGGNGKGRYDFQVGTDASKDSRVRVIIGKQAAKEIFGGVPIKIHTRKGAQKAIDQIDFGLDRLSTRRTVLGSKMNRLVAASQNATHSAVNLQAGAAQQMDVNFGAASTDFAKSRVLMEANISMQAHVNRNKSMALRLIG